MREIKFRAWNKEWGMLLPVDKIFFEDGKPVSISVTIEASDYPHTNEWEDYEIGKDIELMQYTGLKDKNGKGIYEGDILENNTHRKQLIEVYWKGCVKDGENVNGKEWINWGGWYFRKLSNEKEMTYSVDNDQIEIIGNIYENPELLNPHTT